MSNRQDNNPSLDYFELRRRHEEYKNRERQAGEEQAEEYVQSLDGSHSSFRACRTTGSSS